MNLSAAEVIRLSDTWHLETAHIGNLAAGESTVLEFETAGTNQPANQDILSNEDLPVSKEYISSEKNSLEPLNLTSLWQLATSTSSRPGSKKEQPLPALHTLLAPRNEEMASRSAKLQVNNRYIRIRPGETRLVSRIDEELPGVSEKPSAAKKTCANLLVVHLQNPIDPPPESDRNSITDLDLPTVDLFDSSVNRFPGY